MGKKITIREVAHGTNRDGTKFITGSIDSAEAVDLPRGCVWHGCRNNYQGETPPGWMSLVGWRGPQNLFEVTAELAAMGGLEIDTQLCPTHVTALYECLWIPEPIVPTNPGTDSSH